MLYWYLLIESVSSEHLLKKEMKNSISGMPLKILIKRHMFYVKIKRLKRENFC